MPNKSKLKIHCDCLTRNKTKTTEQITYSCCSSNTSFSGNT